MKKTTLKNSGPTKQVKKIFLSLSIMFMLSIGSVSAASDPNVSEEVKASFKKEFTGAQLIEWNDLGEFAKATFIYGDHRTEAYFRKDGQLEGSIRNIFYNQLPLAVVKSVDKRFANADIEDVKEINNTLGTTYQITLASKKQKYLVKADANGNFNDVDKLKN